MKNNSIRMICISLFLSAVLWPTTSIWAEKASYPALRFIHFSFCSDWEYFESPEFAEYRRACFYSGYARHNNATDIYAYVECLEGPGTCEDSELRAWCQTDNPGPDAIQIQNPHRMVVEITPEDCDFSFNSVGTSLSAISNGSETTRIDYESYSKHWINELGQNCMRKVLGGWESSRSASFEAVIEGMYVEGPGYVRTIVTDHFVENCSN